MEIFVQADVKVRVQIFRQVVAAALWLAVFDGVASAETWKVYANARFGEAAEYPADRFVPGRPPDNGDGQSFTTADGAELAIFGSYNVENDTAATYEKFLRGSGTDYQNTTYRAAGDNWLVLSGYRGDAVFYERYMFTQGKNGVIHGMVITYPRAAKALYDPIASRIANSLR